MRRLWLIPLAILLLLTSEAWADVVLIMRREAEAPGNYIRICDIARVEGPREQAEEIAKIVLGRTPGKGQVREYSRWDIEARLYEMGVRARVTFTGNDLVRVFGIGSGRRSTEHSDERSLQPLAPIRLETHSSSGSPGRDAGKDDFSTGWNPTAREAGVGDKPFKPAARVYEPRGNPAEIFAKLSNEAKERIGKSVAEYLAAKYHRPDIEVEAKLLSVDGDIPESVYEVTVEDALGGQVPGKADVRLSVKDTPDSEPRSVVVGADTSVFGLALIAARQLNRDETLDSRDVLVARVRMESGRAYLPPNPNSAAGREMRRSLKAGEPVTTADAAPGEAVKRGELVVVSTRGSGWEINTTAKALGNGMVGDIIQVEDPSNKTKYMARITGHRIVSSMAKKDKLNNK